MLQRPHGGLHGRSAVAACCDYWCRVWGHEKQHENSPKQDRPDHPGSTGRTIIFSSHCSTRVAIAGLVPSQIAYPVRTDLSSPEQILLFQMGEVTAIDFDAARFVRMDGSVIAYASARFGCSAPRQSLAGFARRWRGPSWRWMKMSGIQMRSNLRSGLEYCMRKMQAPRWGTQSTPSCLCQSPPLSEKVMTVRPLGCRSPPTISGVVTPWPRPSPNSSLWSARRTPRRR